MSIGDDNITFSEIWEAVNNGTHVDQEIKLSDFRGLGDVPDSGQISIGTHIKGKTFVALTPLVEILQSLASELNNLNNNDIQSKINDAGFTIFAKIKTSKFAESLPGKAVSTLPYTFADDEFTFIYNTANSDTLGSGKNLVKQKITSDIQEERHFMAMAIYAHSSDGQNGNFEGILLWTFTGSGSGGKKIGGTDKTITNIASLFINDGFNSNNDFWSVYPYFIPRTGNLVTGTESGWRFSNGQHATSDGYYNTGRFASDDGAWAIQFGANCEGNTPGPYLGTDASSYGIINPNGGDGNICQIAGSQKTDFKAYVFYSSLFQLTSLYEFDSHTFTNCGITGRTGPTLANCTSTYSSTSWASNTDYFNMTTQGIQEWTVPKTGIYSIEAIGASGANGGNSNGSTTNLGFKGAKITGTFNLTKGEVIFILVGQRGQITANIYAGAGGGGGTFVVKKNPGGLSSTTVDDVLIVAGGGGGHGSGVWNSPNPTGGSHGQTTLTSSTSGGTKGSGYDAGGGGGLLSDGEIPYSGYTYYGRSFKSGGLGGDNTSNYNQRGGFGGGGAGGAHSAAGGGGMSGGNGGPSTDGSGHGGGSQNNGLNKSAEVSGSLGDGEVTITLLDSLYAFGSHTFGNCGATGKNGPTLANCTSTYSSTSWASNTDYFNMTTQGYQIWTVPMTGTYNIYPSGATGGYSTHGVGGNGRSMRADFNLSKGTKLVIIIGQKGINGAHIAGGGGGGTFVSIENDPLPLIVAGGGGGAGSYQETTTNPSNQDGVNASRENNGTDARPMGPGSWGIAIGSGGTGGNGGTSGESHRPGAGGGGWLTDGTEYTAKHGGGDYGRKGLGYPNGLIGGNNENNGSIYGGFGGGGGGGLGGGGGGGYSGGGGGVWTSGSSEDHGHGGGGGGSYIASSGTSANLNQYLGNSHGNCQITLL